MITEEEQKAEWLDGRIIFNCKLALSQKTRKNEKPLDEKPKTIIFTYHNGKGRMILDQDQFEKLPKSKQNKIMDLWGT